MENAKAMRLTKEDIKHWKSRLDYLVRDKKKELEIVIENKVDKQFNSKYKQFKNKLKLSKEMKELEKNEKELEDFIDSKILKEKQLTEKRDKALKNLIDIFNRQSKIHGWQVNVDYVDSADGFERKLQEVCKNEIKETIIKTTPEGEQWTKIEERKNCFIDTLHHPQLQFKSINFEDAIRTGFSSIGIAFKQLQLTQN